MNEHNNRTIQQQRDALAAQLEAIRAVTDTLEADSAVAVATDDSARERSRLNARAVRHIARILDGTVTRAPHGTVPVNRRTLRYTATALEGSADNGDQYAAAQIRAALAAGGTAAPEVAESEGDPDFGTAAAREKIETFVAQLTPFVTNDTHAWNLWNVFATDDRALRRSLEWAWANTDKFLTDGQPDAGSATAES